MGKGWVEEGEIIRTGESTSLVLCTCHYHATALRIAMTWHAMGKCWRKRYGSKTANGKENVKMKFKNPIAGNRYFTKVTVARQTKLCLGAILRLCLQECPIESQFLLRVNIVRTKEQIGLERTEETAMARIDHCRVKFYNMCVKTGNAVPSEALDTQ